MGASSTFTDPVTGDQLTRGEWVSWTIQRILRRWAFLGLITCITIVAWSTRNDQVLLWWNLAASYLAVMIESLVGIAMFGQTRRDATIIRHIRRLEETHGQQLEALVQEQRALRDLVSRLSPPSALEPSEM